MKKLRILAIAPYEGLKEMIRTVADEEAFADVEVTTTVANFSEAKRLLQDGGEQGYDVILSRGGIGSLLRRMTTVPVVSIEVSGYDYVRAIKLTQLHAGLVAVVGFSAITRNALVVNELLQSGADVVTITAAEEVPGVLERLRDEGVTVIVGDVITVDEARAQGLYGVLLTSGRESVRDALENAVTIARAVCAALCRETHWGRVRKDKTTNALAELDEAALERDQAALMLFENSKTGREAIKRGQRLLELGGPLLVEGEFGVGKGALIHALHAKGPYRHSALLVLNCEEATAADELEEAVETGFFGEQGGGLQVHLVNRLPGKDQERVYKALRKIRGYHIAASSSDSLVRLAAQGKFSEGFCGWLTKNSVFLLPLRERKDDINSLAALYIAECNDHMGQQVIGFEPDALALLRASPWPFNMEQLHTAVERMTMFCAGAYIPKHLVRAEVGALSENLFSNQYISISGKTLDEIIMEVIGAVLRDENMNQVRAAARLGIARSTLWRKLK